MNSKKRSSVKKYNKQKNGIFSSTHGMGLGAGVVVIGWIITASIVTIIGIIIFIPSAGIALSKYLKKQQKH